MNRLDRRITILRGKRKGAFDNNQYYFEKATRTRLARAVRVNLRVGRPVILISPRWSQAQYFLEDIATDLSLGDPSITARTLSLAPLKGLTAHQGWGWLASAIAEFCQVHLEEGPAWQAVSRRGFRTVMSELLDRAEGGRRRCLLLHHLEHLPVDALNDLLDIFREHIDKYGQGRCFNLLLAGSVDAPSFDIEQAARLELSDFSAMEAVEVLVEHHGPLAPHRLRSAVAVAGGVPAVLDALGEGDESELSEIVVNRERMWRVLGPIADEVRAALDIVNADPSLSTRLERVARLGPLPEDPERDLRLRAAGLVRRQRVKNGATTTIRTPWFSELALAS